MMGPYSTTYLNSLQIKAKKKKKVGLLSSAENQVSYMNT